jgi:hypothetical protein
MDENTLKNRKLNLNDRTIILCIIALVAQKDCKWEVCLPVHSSSTFFKAHSCISLKIGSAIKQMDWHISCRMFEMAETHQELKYSFGFVAPFKNMAKTHCIHKLRSVQGLPAMHGHSYIPEAALQSEG